VIDLMTMMIDGARGGDAFVCVDGLSRSSHHSMSVRRGYTPVVNTLLSPFLLNVPNHPPHPSSLPPSLPSLPQPHRPVRPPSPTTST